MKKNVCRVNVFERRATGIGKHLVRSFVGGDLLLSKSRYPLLALRIPKPTAKTYITTDVEDNHQTTGFPRR